MTAYTTLIGPDDLAEHIDHCLVVDCRHDLFKHGKGAADYAQAHIPGARFLSMDEDLSGPKGDGSAGRHPLPDPATLRARLASIGLSDDRQLVVYDADNGSFAARLWWMARWLGHGSVAVLDGGLRAWQAAGYPVTAELPQLASAPGRLSQRPAIESPVSVGDLMADQSRRQRLVLDARAPERYRGDVEPLDPVGGHIPGSHNRPFQLNLRPDGRFKPAQVLQAEFEAALGGRDAASVVHSCGSGVSACHNALAMAHAGLRGAQHFPGSWSQWCADASRPVARGAEPG